MKTVCFIIAIFVTLFHAVLSIVGIGLFFLFVFDHAPHWYIYLDLLGTAFFIYHFVIMWMHLDAHGTDVGIMED